MCTERKRTSLSIVSRAGMLGACQVSAQMSRCSVASWRCSVCFDLIQTGAIGFSFVLRRKGLICLSVWFTVFAVVPGCLQTNSLCVLSAREIVLHETEKTFATLTLMEERRQMFFVIFNILYLICITTITLQSKPVQKSMTLQHSSSLHPPATTPSILHPHPPLLFFSTLHRSRPLSLVSVVTGDYITVVDGR